MFAITRAGDGDKQAFARELGAEWAGGRADLPEQLDAAIVFAPAGELVAGRAARRWRRAASSSAPAST